MKVKVKVKTKTKVKVERRSEFCTRPDYLSYKTDQEDGRKGKRQRPPPPSRLEESHPPKAWESENELSRKKARDL